jgi:hypothetical protein
MVFNSSQLDAARPRLEPVRLPARVKRRRSLLTSRQVASKDRDLELEIPAAFIGN